MFKKYLLFITLSLVVIKASAEYPKTDFDFSLLPQYCKAKLKPSSPAEVKKWSKKLGHDFGHTHHYCAALHSLRRAKNIFSTTPDKAQYKRHLLGVAIGEIDYMEDKASPSYILFPHIYTTKAEIYLESKQPAAAIEYFNKAITANKKFTKPYALLSDYYVEINNKKGARKILEEGLKYSPKSKHLNRRLNKLVKR